MSGGLVTIARFFEPSRAYLLQSILEGHGIEAMVTGEFMGNLVGPVSMFTGRQAGGVELKVAAEDEEEALALLASAEDFSAEEE